MKKIIFLFAFLPVFAFSQNLSIKFNTLKDIVIVPPVTISSDSVIVKEFFDDGKAISCYLHIYVDGENISSRKYMYLTLWGGDSSLPTYLPYDVNKDYTRNEKKLRIKYLLTL